MATPRYGGAIALVVAGQVWRRLGGATDDDHDDAAGIERAGVADALFAQHAADAGDDVVRRRSLELVDDDKASEVRAGRATHATGRAAREHRVRWSATARRTTAGSSPRQAGR